MNKKMRELLEQINAKKVEANDFLAKAKGENVTDADKTDFKAKARKAFDEMKDLQEDYNLEKDSFEADKQNHTPLVPNNQIDNKLQVRAFAKMISKNPMTNDEIVALSSLTGPDGGYLIPQDVQTRINVLQREYVSLRSLITVQPVTVVEGSRVIEEDAEHVPFVDITELTDIPNVNGPGWNKVTFKIRDLGGILPVPNHLLNDETGGLVDYLANWFVKKQYATDNDMILNSDGSKGSQGILALAGTVGGFAKETLTETLTFKKAKSILNKGFPTTISKKAVIVTNQDGLDILDQLEDLNGRPYLTGDGTQEFPYRFKARKVEVYDNYLLPNITIGEAELAKDYAPFIIGSLKDAMILFDRQQMEVASSKEAGFIKNATIMRAIVRQDTRIWDTKAAKVILSPLLTL
jgi:HK97 family phage major capsid protein